MCILIRKGAGGETRKLCCRKDDRAMRPYECLSYHTVGLESSSTEFLVRFLVSQKFSHVPLEVGGWRLGYEERRYWAIIVGAISFQDFRPMWS